MIDDKARTTQAILNQIMVGKVFIVEVRINAMLDASANR